MTYTKEKAAAAAASARPYRLQLKLGQRLSGLYRPAKNVSDILRQGPKGEIRPVTYERKTKTIVRFGGGRGIEWQELKMLEFPKQVSTVLVVVSAMTSFCLPLLLVGMAGATSLNTSSCPRSKPDLCIAARPKVPKFPQSQLQATSHKGTSDSIWLNGAGRKKTM